MDCSPQAPPSMGFSRQEYWNGLPCPPPWVFKPRKDISCLISPVLQAVSCTAGDPLLTEPPGNYTYGLFISKRASQVALVVKESSCQHRRCKRHGFNPWFRKISWRRAWQPSPVSLPGESHGQKSLTGYSPWGRTESDTTEHSTAKGKTVRDSS